MLEEKSPVIKSVAIEKPILQLSETLPSIFLVGPMGAGKTTIGKLLAKHLGRTFVDCDWYIVQQTGADIPWIFEKEGESGFRQRETRALMELVDLPNIVMATGGGVVGSAKNRQLLKQGLVIYLDANVETQLLRTKKDKNRPLLQNDNPRAVLETLYQKRAPLYREVADIIVPTGRAYPKQMVAELLLFLTQYIQNKMPAKELIMTSQHTPTTLTVHTQSHDYPIFIGASTEKMALAQHILPFIKGKQVLIVTNDVVAPLYLSALEAVLGDDFEVQTCILTDGEQYKNQNSINIIYDTLMKHHFARDCTLIALGGGVIGDMVGFAAASYMRGVAFIQVPTTLLAQVDSSVGGKTGINHPLGKNMIGAFWQPVCVLADMATFATLAPREFLAGMAEVVKYALIFDRTFLLWLETHIEQILAKDSEILAQMVYRCCDYKAKIVASDEREAGNRALLNFGHTFGHVIETHQGYGNWLHGEAVSAGMMQALALSCELGLIEKVEVKRVARLLEALSLPIHPPKIAVQTALDLMGHDKKVQQGKIRLVLLKALGEAFVTADFELAALEKVLTGIDDYLL